MALNAVLAERVLGWVCRARPVAVGVVPRGVTLECHDAVVREAAGGVGVTDVDGRVASFGCVATAEGGSNTCIREQGDSGKEGTTQG
jgi:hypothetical protein